MDTPRLVSRESHTQSGRGRGSTRARRCSHLCLFLTSAVSAFNYVRDANGTYWGIQDVEPPRVDTGSIRATQVAPGTAGAYSTSINGFGGIKVLVHAAPAPRFNGELMRG